ncbi:RNA polymerase sigma factor [Fimbriiglobus ruber]|uniref:Uncharacterized protein n=1 Tax=Fimbriiglobus ruber TaxID=1908690 RepID=A0A225CZY3_9BACT|nr:sigma-70 family RNA polymerase sigma factor [Fimbriiglobus ruber]OWK34920.1 hypothetical protein FRUB_09762 [Fimbriiglobus ruber]
MTPIDEEEATVGQLLAAMRAGYQALGQLLRLHQNYLLKIARDIMNDNLKQRQGESDIVSDVFRQVIEHVNRQTSGLMKIGTKEEFRRWLSAVLSNTVAKERRHQGAQCRDNRVTTELPEEVTKHDSAASPSRVFDERQRIESLNEALGELSETERIIIRLKMHWKFSFRDIAFLMDGFHSSTNEQAIQRRFQTVYLQLKSDERLQHLD